MGWEFLLLGLIADGVRGFYTGKGTNQKGSFNGGKMTPEEQSEFAKNKKLAAAGDADAQKRMEELAAKANSERLAGGADKQGELDDLLAGDGLAPINLKQVQKQEAPIERKSSFGDGTHEQSVTRKKLTEYAKTVGISEKEATQQIDAVRSFTRLGFLEIRESQQKGNPTQEAKDIERFLTYQTPFKGRIYRGMNFESEKARDAFIAEMKKGQKTNSMNSWSSDRDKARYFAKEDKEGGYPLMMAVVNKSGAAISGLSNYPEEAEVLVGAGKKYQAKGEKKNGNMIMLLLDEE